MTKDTEVQTELFFDMEDVTKKGVKSVKVKNLAAADNMYWRYVQGGQGSVHIQLKGTSASVCDASIPKEAVKIPFGQQRPESRPICAGCDAWLVKRDAAAKVAHAGVRDWWVKE